MIYKKLRVRVINGGYRLKFCDDKNKDVYLLSGDVKGKTLRAALLSDHIKYTKMVDSTSHKGSNLQGKYDCHHRLQYRKKIENLHECIKLL
jgi:hypothetical protein